jgi:hypothetical protein
MANTSNARGLIPVRHRNGAPYNGAYNIYYVPATYATAMFIGDPVIGITDTADANGIPIVNVGTAAGGAYNLGVCTGVISAGDPMVTRTRDLLPYRLASTAAYVMVCDDPDMLFEAQEDAVGGVLDLQAAGRNIDLIAGTGSANTGYSGWMLDSSTLQTTATLQMRIHRPVERADNDPTLASGKWLVSFNLHAMRNTTGV